MTISLWHGFWQSQPQQMQRPKGTRELHSQVYTGTTACPLCLCDRVQLPPSKHCWHDYQQSHIISTLWNMTWELVLCQTGSILGQRQCTPTNTMLNWSNTKVPSLPAQLHFHFLLRDQLWPWGLTLRHGSGGHFASDRCACHCLAFVSRPQGSFSRTRVMRHLISMLSHTSESCYFICYRKKTAFIWGQQF